MLGMIDIGYLPSIILMLFFFGFCIFIHEFGHLLAAIWRGLHVERFSVGFGHAIKKWTYKGIEYRLSWIPFGGYVAIPQLEPGDHVETSDGKPLPHAKPLDRIIVAFAGPLFNILFGFLLATMVWAIGYNGPKPATSFEVGTVQQTYLTADGERRPTPEAKAGLQPGDIVHKVNGRGFDRGWESAVKEIVFADDAKVVLDITRDGEPKQISYTLVGNPQQDNVGFPFISPRFETQVSMIYEDSPAVAAGLKAGDVILEVNGRDVLNSEVLIETTKASKGAPMDLKVRRGDEILEIAGIQAKEREIEGRVQWMLGLGLAPKVEIVRLHPTPWKQFTEVINLTARTLRSLFDRLNPIRARNMGGPVMIVQAMTQSFHAGFMYGINLVVLITFSLAIVNLLPVPVLDGGHIVFGLVEGIAGRRVPSRVALPLTYAFAFMIIGFMLYVTFHDINRMIPKSAPTEVSSEAYEPAPAMSETESVVAPAEGDALEKDAGD